MPACSTAILAVGPAGILSAAFIAGELRRLAVDVTRHPAVSLNGHPARSRTSRLGSLHDLSGWKPELLWTAASPLFVIESGKSSSS